MQLISRNQPDDNLYIGFSHHGNLCGRLIRWFSGATVDHSFLFYHDLHLGWMTVGANFEAVDYVPLEVFEKKRRIVALFRPKEGTLWRNFKLVRDDLGLKYNLLGVAGMTLVEVMNRYFHCLIANPLSVKGELFCSQFLVTLLRADRWRNFFYGHPASTIDPGQLMAALRTNRDFLIFKRDELVK